MGGKYIPPLNGLSFINISVPDPVTIIREYFVHYHTQTAGVRTIREKIVC